MRCSGGATVILALGLQPSATPTPTGSLIERIATLETAQAAHTATALRSGDLLVAGGMSGGSVIASVNADYASNDRGGWGTDFGANASYRPVSNILLSVGPSWTATRALLQYVRTVADTTATAFSGSRDVLSDLRPRQLGR